MRPEFILACSCCIRVCEDIEDCMVTYNLHAVHVPVCIEAGRVPIRLKNSLLNQATGQPSLACQIPYFCEEREKGSGNTAYNEVYQWNSMIRN